MKGLRVLLIAVLVSAVLPLSVARAQDGSSPTISPTITTTSSESPPSVLDTPPQERGEEPLPFTGADVSLFVVIALVAIGAGTIVVRRTRRSES